MKKAKKFEDLVVWQRAHQLVVKIYKLSKNFPRDELFGLTTQLRRAAVSVPANIVEGFKRATIPDKLRYFNIAQGSLEEVRYYLILSHDLAYADTGGLKEDLEEVSRLLEAYMKSLKKRK
jgi:four helix bundle protein